MDTYNGVSTSVDSVRQQEEVDRAMPAINAYIGRLNTQNRVMGPNLGGSYWDLWDGLHPSADLLYYWATEIKNCVHLNL